MRTNHIIETSAMTYEPWSDGYAVGFKVTRASDGKVGYVYLNPSMDEDGSTPDIFIYQGSHGDPHHDLSAHYYEIDDDVFRD